MDPARHDSGLLSQAATLAPDPGSGRDATTTPSLQPESSDIKYDEEFKTFLKEFKSNASLTRRDVQDFEGTAVDDVKAVIAAIQRKHVSDNKQLYMRRLEMFLVSMESYGKVIEVFLNAPVVANYLAFIWVSLTANGQFVIPL